MLFAIGDLRVAALSLQSAACGLRPYYVCERVIIIKLAKNDGMSNLCGAKIKHKRVVDRISQEQLAAKLQLDGLGITQKAISRIETGKRIVTDYELVAFAKALDAPVPYLLGLEDDEKRDGSDL